MPASKNSWTFYVARDYRLREYTNKAGKVIPHKTTLIENNTLNIKSIWDSGPEIRNVKVCSRGYHSSSSFIDAIRYAATMDIVVLLCLNSGNFKRENNKVVASRRHVIGYVRLKHAYNVIKYTSNKHNDNKKTKRLLIKMIKEQGVINPKYKDFNFSIDRKPKLK